MYGPQQPYWQPPPPPNKAKSRVRTLAIVQLVFAGLGAYGLVSNMIPQRDPMARKMMDMMWAGDMGTWMRISTGVSAIFTALLLAAGLCLLKQKSVGRTLTLAHAIAGIVFGVISAVVTQVLMGRVVETFAKDMGPAADIVKTSMSVALLFGTLGGMVFQIVELYLMTRPDVKALMTEWNGGQSTL